MKTICIITFAVLATTCAQKENKRISEIESPFKLEIRDKQNGLRHQQNAKLKLAEIAQEKYIKRMARYNNILQSEINNATLQGKRDQLIRDFFTNNSPSAPDFGTLIDLNYDNYLDFIIGYYGQAGSGIKNRIEVHLFDPQKNNYKQNQLSSIPNPSFYLEDKIITGFYLGEGKKVEWIQYKWVTTKTTSVTYAPYPDSAYSYINYPLTGKTDSVLDLYRGVPRQDILRNDYGEL
ncbi:MAG: hypothetical protein P8I55_02155 [Crocinitomix sp.]|nr:hypothetical protein [Crocinitomix sp.]